MRVADVNIVSRDGTTELARRIGKRLRRGDLIELFGEMGSGKTTFTTELAHSVGVTRRVTSPTFVTMREYLCDLGTFVHCDLYRVESRAYFEELGVPDLLEEGAIVVVEWPEMADVPETLEPLAISIANVVAHGSEIDSERRSITLSGGDRWTSLLEELHGASLGS